MKGKQIIALVVAAVLFIIIGATNLLVQVEAEKQRATGVDETPDYMELLRESRQEIDYASKLPYEDFIGVINVTGTIQNVEEVYGNTEYDHQGTLDYIDALADSYSNQAILLYEETPGGTVIDADELYLKLMDYKEKTGRPVYAYMHSYAYSGGYYIAMAADKIYANRNATTGSIGVIMSTYNLKGLYDKLGIEEINITSGDNKAMFTGDDAQTEKQIQIYQEIVDQSYSQFLDIVEKGRNMTEDEVKPYADGSVFSAQKAKEIGLIDEIVDTYAEAQEKIAGELDAQNIDFSVMPKKKNGILNFLFSKAAELIPKSDNQVLQELSETKNKGLMYYAEP